MRKVILISHDPIGKQMAGPGIRYFEFAKALSKKHPVTLYAPHIEEGLDLTFECKINSLSNLQKEKPKAIISQNFSPFVCYFAKKQGAKLILDAYDPEMIEYLELNKHKSIQDQKALLSNRMGSLLFSLKMADFVACASDRQKDLWLGVLSAIHKIDPALYLNDPYLKECIDTVPFGIPSTPPEKLGVGPKQRLNLKPSDKLLLWGGGIWNWFDPITLLKAMEILSKERKDIHLLFMGTEHPNSLIPKMKMAKEALALAEELKLKDNTVHFNFGWTPYAERQNTLLDADIGLSLHFDNLETRFSFRTRILDYLWAELPIISTKGDFFADLIDQKNLGTTIPYQDPKALVKAILSIIDDPNRISEIKTNIRKEKDSFHWESIIKPIERALQRDEAPLSSFQKTKNSLLVIPEYIRQKGILNIMKRIAWG